MPEGFRVIDYPAEIDVPSFSRTDGGVWLASTGPGGDHNVVQLRALFDAVEGAVRRPVLPVHLVDSEIDSVDKLSDLIRRKPPEVTAGGSIVVWTFQEGSLEGWADEPKRLQELLQRLHRLASLRGRDEPVRQVVFVHDPVFAETPWVFRLIGGLGLEVRQFPILGNVVVADVYRPGGMIISTMFGKAHPLLDGDIDSSPAMFNQEKDDADVRGDRERLERIEAEERRALERIIPPRSARAPRALRRAPLLRSLVLRAAIEVSPRTPEDPSRGDAAWGELCRYLLARDTALLHAANNPKDGAVEVYPDLECLNALVPAADNGDYELTLLPPVKLFAFVLEKSSILALRAIGNDGPVRVLFSPAAVRALASGQVPPRR